MVVNLAKKVLKNIVRKKWIVRKRIYKLKENQTRVKSYKELITAELSDLWKTFKDGVLKARDEVCKKRKCRRD